jgi:uncharacterized protein involved in outer membrane biogenesis
MRKTLYGVVAVVFVLAAAVLLAPHFIDLRGMAAPALQAAKESTGRDIRIGGIGLALLPRPTATVTDLRVSNVQGASEPDMVRVKAVEVSVALLPLLSRRVEVRSVTLVEPVVTIETLKDGRSSLDFPKAKDAGAGGGIAVSLESVSVRNGALVMRDATGGQRRIEAVNLTGSAGSLAGPIAAKGSARALGVPASVDLALGRMEPGKPASLSLTLEGAGARMHFAGSLTGAAEPGQPPAIAGKLAVAAASLNELAKAANAGGGALPPLAAQPFSLDATIKGTPAQLAAQDIALALGDTRGIGALALGLGDKTTVQFALNVGKLDLDKLLAQAAPAAASAPGPAAAPVAAAAAAPIPPNLVAAIDIGIEGIAYRGQAMQKARLVVEIVNGVVVVKQLSAQLPAASSLTVANLPVPLGGPPPATQDGRIEAQSGNLRALLDWLGADLSALPAGRLGRLDMKAGVRSDAAGVQIANLDATLDASRLTGAMSLAWRNRPAIGVRAKVDRLNLDAYLPGARPAPARPARLAQAQPVQPAGGAAPAAGPYEGLKALESFDLNLQADIDSLTYRETPIQDVRMTLELVNGRLAIKEATVRDLAGAQAAMTLVVEKMSSAPAFSTAFNLRATDAKRFLKFASGYESPLTAQQLGQINAKGTVAGTMDGLKIDTTLEGFGGAGRIAGTMDQLGQQTPRVDLAIDASFPEFGPLLGLLAGERAKQGGQKLGPFALKSRIANTAADAITLKDTELRAFGGELDLAGTITQMASPTPTVDLGVSMKLPSLRPLLTAFNPDPTLMATADRLGGVTLAGKAIGNAKKVSLRDAALTGLGGSIRLNGDVMDAGSQLDLTAEMQNFTLGPLLAAMPGVITAQGAQQLGPVNGRLSLKGGIDNLGFGMQNLSMAGFGGTMALNGQIADALDPTRRADLAFDIANLAVGPMLAAFPGAGVPPAIAQNLQTLTAKGTVKGSAAAPSLTLQQGTAQAFGGTVSLTGTVSEATTPQAKYDLTASVAEVDAMRLLTAFYRPSSPIPGKVRFDNVRLVGDGKRIQITNLVGTFGPIGISGQGTVAMDGPRPKIDLQVRTSGEIIVDPFLPAAGQQRGDLAPGLHRMFGEPDGLVPAGDRPGTVQFAQQQQPPWLQQLPQILQPPPQPRPQQAPQAQPQPQPQPQPAYQPVTFSPPPQGGEVHPRWSREPFRLDMLKAYDVNARIDGLQSLRFGKYAVQNAAAQVTAQNGVLTVSRIAATAFGGQLTGDVALDATQVPKATLHLTLVNADAHEVMKAVANNDRLQGRISADAKFQFAGRNEAEAISTLTGGAALQGEVRARLKQGEQLLVGGLQGLGGILGGNQIDMLAQDLTTATGGYASGLVGMLSFVGLMMVNDPGRITGTVDFRNGLMTERDLQIVNSEIALTTGGWVSLPLYRQDFAIEAYRRQAAPPPPGQAPQPYIAAQLRGPLDKPNTRVYGERVARGGGGIGPGMGPSVLQDLLSGRAGAAGQQPVPAPGQAAPQKADPAQQLLQQLLRPRQQ